MDRRKWKDVYGSVTEESSFKFICWFHLHQDGGCKLPDGKECYNSHEHFPQACGGKNFAALTSAEQVRISDSVAR
jgi:hypothetical protein